MDLNKVQLIGRLTRDPEVKTTTSGQNVATFSVATSREWKDQQSGEKKSQTEFHNVVAWRKLADIVSQYLTKGRQVYIEGYLQTRSWDDPSGTKKYRTEIVADNMIMLGSNPSGGQGGGPQYGGGQSQQAPSYSNNQSTQSYAAVPPSAAETAQNAPQPSVAPGEDVISVEDIPF